MRVRVKATGEVREGHFGDEAVVNKDVKMLLVNRIADPLYVAWPHPTRLLETERTTHGAHPCCFLCLCTRVCFWQVLRVAGHSLRVEEHVGYYLRFEV